VTITPGRRTVIAILALVAGSCVAGCGEGDPESGRLTVYSAGPRDLAEQLVAEFTAATGIEVELFVATTGQVMAKLEAERFNPRADVALLASGLAADGLRDARRLLAHAPPGIASTPSSWHDPMGFHHAPSASAVGIALRNASGDHSESSTLEWSDALTGALAARAIMPSPARSGSSGDFVLAHVLQHGEDGWLQFAAARRRGMEISGANAQAITSLRLGSHDAIVGAVDYLIFREIARGERFTMHFPPSGVPIVPRPAAILASTPRPEAARRFVDFLFSPAAQRLIADAHLMPADGDVEPSPQRAAAGVPVEMQIDRRTALAAQRPALRRFQYQIERAVIVR